MSDLRTEIGRFAGELDRESNAASDLWTWLPSYKVAERHHGDYAGEHRPSVAEVMNEAAIYLGHLGFDGKVLPHRLTEDEAEWLIRCPCGEPHEEAS